MVINANRRLLISSFLSGTSRTIASTVSARETLLRSKTRALQRADNWRNLRTEVDAEGRKDDYLLDLDHTRRPKWWTPRRGASSLVRSEIRRIRTCTTRSALLQSWAA